MVRLPLSVCRTSAVFKQHWTLAPLAWESREQSRRTHTTASWPGVFALGVVMPRAWRRYPAGSVGFLDRFWSKVVENGADECWGWLAKRQAFGYGVIMTKCQQSSRRSRHVGAHVVAWTLTNALDVRKPLQVLHSCDNPICCNPRHLHVGTQSDNLREASERGRMRFGIDNPSGRQHSIVCKHGHWILGVNGRAKGPLRQYRTCVLCARATCSRNAKKRYWALKAAL